MKPAARAGKGLPGEAQDIIYDARELRDPRKRVAMLAVRLWGVLPPMSKT
jgi:hypothetical protein